MAVVRVIVVGEVAVGLSMISSSPKFNFDCILQFQVSTRVCVRVCKYYILL